MKKALLVGINQYPTAPLRGCVNDVIDMAEFLVDECDFDQKEIRLLVDGRATTEEILARMDWLVTGLKAGDKVFFQFSGHGVQVPTRNEVGEVDGLDEVICPFDFDWTEERLIRDDTFAERFAKIPKGASFIWVSDSCHSGDLCRDLPPPQPTPLSHRGYPLPADVAWRIQVAVAEQIKLAQLAHSLQTQNFALISGCKSNQTSADASFNGRFNGALTHFLLDVLGDSGFRKKSLATIVPEVASRVAKASYGQEPQLDGSVVAQQQKFFA